MSNIFAKCWGRFFLSVAIMAPMQVPALIWQPYSLTKVQQAMAAHKVVVIDYSAEWCPGCKDLERVVFSDPVIMHKLSQLVTLRVDATNMEDARVQSLIDQYNVVGLPTVVFLDDQGKEISQARIEGAASLPEFSKALDLVAQKTHMVFN